MGDKILLMGAPAMVLVPLVVEWLKSVGVSVRFAGVASVLVAGGLAALSEAVHERPGLTSVARVVLAAILVGMAGSGTYSQVRTSPHPTGPGVAPVPDTSSARTRPQVETEWSPVAQTAEARHPSPVREGLG
ncbi:MAG: hypothetical protein WKH64_17520 [Chloroflexia bacterium]